MSNPFDDKDGTFIVIINKEGQHSLWPEFIETPAGWDHAFGPQARHACLEFVDQNWTDMRPRSLIEAETASAL